MESYYQDLIDDTVKVGQLYRGKASNEQHKSTENQRASI